MVSKQGSGGSTRRRYSPEEKTAAVRMVRTLRAELGTDHGTVQRVETQLGYGIESVRSWVKQADVDDDHFAGVTMAFSFHLRGFRIRAPSGRASLRLSPRSSEADCDRPSSRSTASGGHRSEVALTRN